MATQAQPLVPGSANISIREYIYFIPIHPLPKGTPIPYTPGLPHKNPLHLSPQPFEPTSTLVLTSPNSIFVDIRLLKPLQAGDPPLPNENGPNCRLEWCFAGTSSSEPVEGRENEGITHSKWNHWVDSKYAVGSPNVPLDEGDMYPVGGSADLVLEHGSSVNVVSGTKFYYEEMWRDIPMRTDSSGAKCCVVLRTSEEVADAVRGVVIRLGQYCQGIIRTADGITIERWEYMEEDHSWMRTARVGESFLPCKALCTDLLVDHRSTIEVAGIVWLCEESVKW